MAYATPMIATCLLIAGGALMSSTMFPPSNVPLQLSLVTMWYVLGLITAGVWR